MTVIVRYLSGDLEYNQVTKYEIKKKFYYLYSDKHLLAIIPKMCPITFIEEGHRATNT